MTIPSDFWLALAAVVALCAFIGSLIAFADSRIKGVAVRESKARHDSFNDTQVELSKLESDMKAGDAALHAKVEKFAAELFAKLDALRDWAAPRVELASMEGRVNEKIGALGNSIDRQIGDLRSDTRSIDQKVSGISREISALTALMTRKVTPDVPGHGI